MLKKLTTLLAVATVLAACSGCGVKNDPEPPKPASSQQPQ